MKEQVDAYLFARIENTKRGLKELDVSLDGIIEAATKERVRESLTRELEMFNYLKRLHEDQSASTK